MSKEQSIYRTWEGVISNFLLEKCNSDEEKYIKEVIKKFEVECKRNAYYGSKLLIDYFGVNKPKRGENESTIEFQRRRLEECFEIEDDPGKRTETIILGAPDRDAYKDNIEKITEKYNPVSWISEASNNASSVNFATHVSKLTHSKINTPSIYDQVRVTKTSYVTTSSLGVPEIDGAVAGNQFAPIFQFLELECNGVKLASELANENSQALREISEVNHLDWNKGFKKALVSSEAASHILAKQVYFPVVEKRSGRFEDYHLLNSMKSSSLAQKIFEKSAAKAFSDHQREIRENYLKKEKYFELKSVSFPNKGKISVTASNHSNASQLNGKRGGKLHLFPSAPPVWKSQSKPPIYQNTLFDSHLRRHIAKDDIDYLREFLIRFDQIELSIKHPRRKQWVDEWVGKIIDAVLDYAAYAQGMEPGWAGSEGIQLKREHQLFLDPYNTDESFQAERKQNAWQAVVCSDFARWLNWVLTDKDNKFSPQREHTRMWLELMETPLREFDELVTMDIKAAKVNA
ncbi:MAG: type I-F CRISPR-associated protein Csy1 [Pseudohongiellaceae bacterium]